MKGKDQILNRGFIEAKKVHINRRSVVKTAGVSQTVADFNIQKIALIALNTIKSASGNNTLSGQIKMVVRPHRVA